MINFTYDPYRFDVDSLSQAKWTILSPGDGLSTEEKWAPETERMVKWIGEWLPKRNATCLDYGSGVGRLAKPLIDIFGWSVIGADISSSMRYFANDYVGSRRYLTLHPDLLDDHFAGYFDYAISVLTLQHCQSPAVDIARIIHGLKQGGRLFVLNAVDRFVPAREVPWINDGINVFALLDRHASILYAAPVVDGHKWAIYQKSN